MTCPYPEKRAYRSEKAARKAMRLMLASRQHHSDHLHPYRCGGHWHLGGAAWARRRGTR